MKTISIVLVALVTSSCIELSGSDVTTTPTEADVVGVWHGFAAMSYCRFEFQPDGTGVAAMDYPGTNVTAEVRTLTWHTTASNLVVIANGDDPNECHSLHGRLLEGTLILNDPSDSEDDDLPLVQIIRIEDSAKLDRELEELTRKHQRSTSSP